MSEIPAEPNKEVPFSEVPKGLLQNWQMASWLGADDRIKARLSTGGIIGLTIDELRQVERFSSRTTNEGFDPPIYLLYERPDTSGKAIFKVQRYSKTNDEWEDLLVAEGDIRGNALLITTRGDKDGAIQNITPILDKVGLNNEMLGARVCENSGQPNRMLMRSYFATEPKDAYWLQFDSPTSTRHAESESDPLYRVYFNPEINDLDQYNQVAAPLVRAAREIRNWD